MNIANATPFPATFDSNAGDASPKEFLVFLRNLISQNFDGDRSKCASRESWVTIVMSLTDHFLAPLPSYRTAPWNAMHEKVKLVEVTLELIQRVTDCVDAFYTGPGDLAKKLTSGLIKFCCGLDIWMDVEVPKEDGIPLPSDLRQRTFEVATGILRHLGNNVTLWRTLRGIIIECLDVSRDVISLSPQTTFPATIVFYHKTHLQEREKEDLDRTTECGYHCITIEAPSQVPLFLGLIVNLLSTAVSPALLCQWFLVDVILKMSEMASSVADFCLSPSCNTTSIKRARSLAQVVTSSGSLLSLSLGFDGALTNVLCRLLQVRLRDGPNANWEALDLALAQVLRLPSVSPPVDAVIFASDVLRKEAWGEAGQNLRDLAVSYLRSCIPRLEGDNLRAAIDALSAVNRPNDELLMQGLECTPITSCSNNGVQSGIPIQAAANWRLSVKTNAQEILLPDSITWMDDDDTLSDQDYLKRVLDDINNRFTSALHQSSSSARLELARKLTKLSCSVAHPQGSECVPIRKGIAGNLISTYIAIVYRLMDGDENEVTPAVRQRTYDMLGSAVKHYPANLGDDGLSHAGKVAVHGMIDKDRNVRLSAGHIFVEITKAQGTHGVQQTESLFASLHGELDASRYSVKETMLVSIGSVGKVSEGEVLGHAVYLLTSQLGSQNPVLKGVAYMQLTAIAKRHNKSPYALVLPYLSSVAPLLVSRIGTDQSLLTEACRFLSTSTSDFLTLTLSRTLPHLFANGDTKALGKIAQELSKKVSALFLNFSHHILAFVLLLPSQSQTDDALKFIIKVLREAAGNAQIELKNVVKSSLVEVLAELVVVLGDDDPKRAKRALEALEMVQRTVFIPVRGQRAPPPRSLGLFLEEHMLGVMSEIHEMLQDVQGKKTMSSKRQILRSFGSFVTHIGTAISNVAPQVMATFQTTVGVPELAEVTLESWFTFLSTLAPHDIGPHVGPTTASIVSAWPNLTPLGRESATRTIEHIILAVGANLGNYLDDVADLATIPELRTLQERLKTLRKGGTPKGRLRRLLERSTSENVTVAEQSLRELKAFMLTEHQDLIQDMASGDVFDPFIGQILTTLFSAACRDSDSTESLRLLAFECIGVLGAVDPDRLEMDLQDKTTIVLHNFTDEGESVIFALHLIADLLVGAYRSTSDIKHQIHLAYGIQELLKFCKFTPALVTSGPNHPSVPLKVRNRWDSLQKHVLETVTPLLQGRFTANIKPSLNLVHPIYPVQSTYREWIQLWTSHLITRAAGKTAETIFGVLHSAVRNKDVGVARHILPHLVLNILISGNVEDSQCIRSEILAVLEDQVNNDSESTADKKLLSAQAVFMLLDHLSKWVRIIRQDIGSRKPEPKRSRPNQYTTSAEDQLLRVDSILSSIDQHLMAKAALQCKAYARALMNFEAQAVALQATSPDSKDLPLFYERLHEIYAHLDEPDGMEGISTLIMSPSLEHQIRQHESTGKWTSAQSCWEVRLQQSPDNLDYHLGLLRCLRNLGHYDTLRTHVKGVLTRNPDWGPSLAGFQVECAWMVGAWDDVQNLVSQTNAQTAPIVMARLLLAMRTGNASTISQAASAARLVLGSPITASGAKGYRRSYDAVLDLHLTHELEVIHNAISNLPDGSQSLSRRNVLADLSRTLSSRLDVTLPTFRAREPVLSMRRAAFALSPTPRPALTTEIGRSWLASAKIARKAGQWQTAYCSMLQAQQSGERFSFVESAKLLKTTGEPLRALQELENSMRLLGIIEERSDLIDLTDDDESKKRKAKAHVLRARWMNDSGRYESNAILKTFQSATDLHSRWESGHFHLGQYHDECFKALSAQEQLSRGLRMNLYTVRFFAKAIKFGSKYVYQTVPRLLTIWLDVGENAQLSTNDIFGKLNDTVARAIDETPAYKWYTAFPQIVSRVGHTNKDVYAHLNRMITTVLREYPKQALWLFTSVVKSNQFLRAERGRGILEQLRSNPQNDSTSLPSLVSRSISMTNELLALCDYQIADDKKTLSMSRDFPRLLALGQSSLIIPLQESLNASLPPASASESLHQPFPINAPTFERFYNDIEIMKSLAKPRKLTIRGSNGQIYMFLGKPKDDLRKDARLMDFNAIVNKLLKANSESRRRQLHIRTYGVITLNEECGFIQWVPNTIPIRPVLLKAYEAKRIRAITPELNEALKDIKAIKPDKEAGQLFIDKVLSKYPPVFHEWFIETFPEPSAWLTSRLTYGRTAAVMSMVGFIIGLGDRHLENILLDTNTGDVVHVDFNCLFEKGKTLETPERVPFRLTQNLVDGLGVTGVEGAYRIACEVTLQLLRDNKDSLMSVLDAFIHDPLVEWEDERRKMDREPSRRNLAQPNADLQKVAKTALSRIEKKLKGIYSTKEKQAKEVSTTNLVQMLIQEASDPANLGRMYVGWAAWH